MAPSREAETSDTIEEIRRKIQKDYSNSKSKKAEKPRKKEESKPRKKETPKPKRKPAKKESNLPLKQIGNIKEELESADKPVNEAITEEVPAKVLVSKKKKRKTKLPMEALDKIRQQLAHDFSGPKGKTAQQVSKQRGPATETLDNANHPLKKGGREYILTGVPGFDDLFETGIPKGASMLVAGGAGSGKTIMSLQILNEHALQGKKCLYMSFEESEERLIEHMEDFGWNPREIIKKRKLRIQRFNPFDITRNVDALLMQAKGELLIDIDPVILPEGFKPEVIIVDSLTAIASAFVAREDSYRVYIEQLFRFFEKIGANSFLITETTQIPTIYSTSGVEEFLADGVIVLYNIKRGTIRENAIEILKLRGADHQKKIVAFEITNEGMVVYPEQEVFGEIGEE